MDSGKCYRLLACSPSPMPRLSERTRRHIGIVPLDRLRASLVSECARPRERLSHYQYEASELDMLNVSVRYSGFSGCFPPLLCFLAPASASVFINKVSPAGQKKHRAAQCAENRNDKHH
ncbi:hypothetical protein EYF80_056846 [Liparis tanakae]|uniref:Uncharacterized protein n=1 Tax=Liparis tanakae TaxID=230148 RepID=A0A4Z2EWI1_9TELE|nr:hypothetical protein EYF80_056846 [Liparis tanakae]